MKRFAKMLLVLFALILIGSLALNFYMASYITEQGANYRFLVYENANSRPTYFTVHNVLRAHEITKGKGIKVGIMDSCFAYERQPDLYSGGGFFTGDLKDYNSYEHHGYWMATTLREIAPEVEIYALGVSFRTEEEKIDGIVEAIDWAIEQGLDVLTYSSAPFSEENRHKIDKAVERALQHNIVTTFIHYPHDGNLFPDGLVRKSEDYSREPDLNILHYDYNVIIVPQDQKYLQASSEERWSLLEPGTSWSSTSPVTAGFVAMLKSIDNTLAPEDYKNILISTSREATVGGDIIPRVVDIYEAVKYISALVESK